MTETTTTPATDAEIAALKAAAERATPGPWYVHEEQVSVLAKTRWIGRHPRPTSGSGICKIIGDPGPPARKDADAAFIALANPSTILALLARLDAAERTAQHYRNACAEADDRAQAAEARAERLAAVLEAEREERRAERVVQEAENAMCRAQERDDPDAEGRHVKWHADACEALNLAHQRAEAARAALAAERGEAEGGAPT